jgi:tripartite-type tricarboxylate transporter receptor subunit TctC
MKLPRRRFLHLAAGAAVLPALSGAALALDYPTRPVPFVVGFPGGSATDIVGRLIAQSLSERLGQQVIVDNRPGAASNIVRCRCRSRDKVPLASSARCRGRRCGRSC